MISHIWAFLRENRFSGFPTRSDTNRVVHPNKMAGGLGFRIKIEEERSHYPCRENKGTDRPRCYREADLCLCFFAYAKSGFPMTRLNYLTDLHYIHLQLKENKNKKILLNTGVHVVNTLHICCVSYLPGNYRVESRTVSYESAREPNR